MKKFIISILILVLIAGAGVGGYFIGKTVQSDNKMNISNQEVVEVLDKFCYGAGWLTENKSDEGSTTLSKEVYEEDVIDYNGQESLIKLMIFVCKYTLLNQEVKPGQYYVSEATYKLGENYTYSGKMGLYYELRDNCVFIDCYDFINDITATLIVDIAPKSENTYVMNILTDSSLINNSFNKGITLQQLYLDQYAEKIYSYSMFAVETEETDLAEIDVESVTQAILYGCDIRTNEKLTLYKEDIINEQNYTFDALMGKLAEQTARTNGVVFDYKEFVKTDALKQAYLDFGYTVI